MNKVYTSAINSSSNIKEVKWVLSGGNYAPTQEQLLNN
jgi:hypothetical protein